jgi:hypothetical protein
MSKYFPALILVAMVALAAFAADVWNVGVASVDTSGNAIFGGTVTATGRVSAAGFTSTAVQTNTSIVASGAIAGATIVGSTSVSSPKLSVLTNATVASGFFTTIHDGGANTGLVFIAGGFTNVIDADITR